MATSRAPTAALREGLVVASHGRHVWIETAQGERWMCHARGKKSQTVVGDRVLCMGIGSGLNTSFTEIVW